MRTDSLYDRSRRRRKSPSEVATELVEIADEQCARGELAAAVAAYEQAILCDSSCLAALQGRSAILAVLEAPDNALAMYEDALSATGDHPELLVGRGHVRLHTGDARGALEDYGHAMRISPKSADYRAFRARARERLGDVVGAIVDYREAARMARPIDAVVAEAALRAVRLEIELGLGSSGA